VVLPFHLAAVFSVRRDSTLVAGAPAFVATTMGRIDRSTIPPLKKG